MNTVSAIIVNWNGKEETADCVRSLLDQDYPHLEIIVSDNGSTDGSIPFLKETFPEIKLIENGENLGFGAAVNRGFSEAQGDYLLFLNNDLVLDEHCVTALVDLLASDADIGAAVPKILYRDHPDTINSFGVLVHYTGIACPDRIDQKDSPRLEITETACGGIFLWRRDLYDRLGGFDEDLFLYHEDHDLSWRIRLSGLRILVTPEAVMYHHYHFNKGVRKFYSSEKNRLHLLLKNMRWKTLAWISPGLVLIEFAQIGHSLLHGWFWLKMRSYVELLGLLPRILHKRNRLESLRQVPDRHIVGLYQGKLAVSGMNHPLMDRVLSPILETYWKWARRWI